jgi:hypothetical protein
MGLWNGKKVDPITERARVLSAEISALEEQIRQLDSQLQAPTHRATISPPPALSQSNPRTPDTVFESVDHQRVTAASETGDAASYYNDLGVRKYDLAGAWRRLQQNFRGPPASNPRLINYLAAGSIQGLRPLRYEKRVARNRVLALALVLVLVLWGIIAVFLRT